MVPRGRLELPHPNGYQRLKCSARASLRWRAKPHPLRDWFESLQVHEVGELGGINGAQGETRAGSELREHFSARCAKPYSLRYQNHFLTEEVLNGGEK